MKKKLLITGADGYLGKNIKNFLKNKYEIFSFARRRNRKDNYFFGDIIDAEDVYRCVKTIVPDIVIHAAALSSLVLCEKNSEMAEKTNFQGTVNLLNAIRSVNPQARLIFFSSDYVFEGTKGDYKENDVLKPQTVYGKTKAMAEEKIQTSTVDYVIVRTANVFGKGGNFFEFTRKNILEKVSFEAFNDVFYTPTYIDYFLDSLSLILNRDFKGVIHLAGKERLSRYEFICYLAQAMSKDFPLIKPVNQPDGGLLAKDSSLNTDLCRKILNNFLPDIQDSINLSLGNTLYPYFSFLDPRGEILGLFQDKNWQEVNLIISEKGCTRGNHYHKKTKEAFLIIQGRVKVSLKKVKDGQERIFTVKEGNTFIVEPFWVHTFEVLENSKWINFLSKPMSSESMDFFRPGKAVIGPDH